MDFPAKASVAATTSPSLRTCTGLHYNDAVRSPVGGDRAFNLIRMSDCMQTW